MPAIVDGSFAATYVLMISVFNMAGRFVWASASDKLGRKKLFIITLAVYLVGSGLTALTLSNGTGWLVFLYATRFIAGMGDHCGK